MSQIRHTPVAATHSQVRSGGDVIDRHRHDDHQLIYVSSGVIAIGTEHGSWVASGDRALWVPAGTWHEHRFYGPTRFHTVGFPVDGTEPVLSSREPTIIAVDPLVRELLVALTGPALGSTETGHLHAVLRDRLRRVVLQPITLPAARDQRLSDACHLVDTDLQQPWTLAGLARRVHTSERTLSRLFRDEFGMSFPQWRTRTRIFNAMVLLAEGHTVTDTAHACGWATTSAFVHTFAQSMGSTPGAYSAGARRAPQR